MNKTQYVRFLKDFANGKEDGNLNDYGPMVCPLVHNVTDLTPEEAKDKLEEL